MLRRCCSAGRGRGSRRACVIHIAAVRRVIPAVIGILVVIVVRAIIAMVRIFRLLDLAVAAVTCIVIAELWWRIVATHRR